MNEVIISLRVTFKPTSFTITCLCDVNMLMMLTKSSQPHTIAMISFWKIPKMKHNTLMNIHIEYFKLNICRYHLAVHLIYILYICIYVQEYTDVSKCKLILKWYMNKIQTTEETNLLDYNEEEKKRCVAIHRRTWHTLLI